jgi:hypothetical protein
MNAQVPGSGKAGIIAAIWRRIVPFQRHARTVAAGRSGRCARRRGRDAVSGIEA